MVNINNGTKMMVHRYMELLKAKIAHAQSRHIAKRVSLKRHNPRNSDRSVLQREREKNKIYESSKRLSMWEQNREGNKANQSDEESRLDHSHYTHQAVNERKYECTWVNFPEMPKPKRRQTYFEDKEFPHNRRKLGERPETAKPWDAAAEDFIKRWDNRFYRNRDAKSSSNFTNPTKNGHLHGGTVRGKMFYY